MRPPKQREAKKGEGELLLLVWLVVSVVVEGKEKEKF